MKQFYAAIEKEPALKVSLYRIPDPPPLMVTKEQKRAYKKTVLKAFNEQIAEPLRALNHQAMLARDERNRRVEVERPSAERVAAAERNEREALAGLAPFQILNERLFGENQHLKQKEVTLGRAVYERDERLRLAGVRIEELEARRRDVPLPEVDGAARLPGRAARRPRRLPQRRGARGHDDRRPAGRCGAASRASATVNAQVESVFSAVKRKLSAKAPGRSDETQRRQATLTLPGTLAHDVLVWAREWLSAARLTPERRRVTGCRPSHLSKSARAP